MKPVMLEAEKKDKEGFWLIPCPKRGRDVPIYQCAGSGIRRITTCKSAMSVLVSYSPKFPANTTCVWPEELKELKLSPGVY